jgi:hypothetical protein
MRADIVPGAVFPDYELPDHRGKHRELHPYGKSQAQLLSEMD